MRSLSVHTIGATPLTHRCQFATRVETRAASLNGLKPFTTGNGSTAPSVLNHLWTLKRNSTKNTYASCICCLATKSRQGQFIKL